MRKADEKVSEGDFVGLNRVINLIEINNRILIREKNAKKM